MYMYLTMSLNDFSFASLFTIKHENPAGVYFLDLQFKKTEISSGNYYYFLILCSEINNN